MVSTEIDDLLNKYYKAEQEFSNTVIKEIIAHVTKYGQADKNEYEGDIISLRVRIPRQDGCGAFGKLFVKTGSLYCQYEDSEAVCDAEFLFPHDLYNIYTTL